MNLIIRILVVLFALLLVAFATVLLITPSAVADFIGRLEEVSPIARIAAVIILYLIALGLITLRFRSRPRTDGDMLYVRAAGAQAALTIGSVRDRILKSVSQVPGVASVEAELKSINGRADVELNVATTDDKVNIPEKQREIYRILEQVIKKQLGVDLANRPRINIELGRTPPPPPTASTVPESAQEVAVTASVQPSTPSVLPAAPMATLASVPASVPVDAPPAAPASYSADPTSLSEANPKDDDGVSTDAAALMPLTPVPLPLADESDEVVMADMHRIDDDDAEDLDAEFVDTASDEDDFPRTNTELL